MMLSIVNLKDIRVERYVLQIINKLFRKKKFSTVQNVVIAEEVQEMNIKLLHGEDGIKFRFILQVSFFYSQFLRHKVLVLALAYGECLQWCSYFSAAMTVSVFGGKTLILKF